MSTFTSKIPSEPTPEHYGVKTLRLRYRRLVADQEILTGDLEYAREGLQKAQEAVEANKMEQAQIADAIRILEGALT